MNAATPGQAASPLLSDNREVMDGLMAAMGNPEKFLPRAPMESYSSWQRRAIVEHIAPLIIAHAAAQKPHAMPGQAPGDPSSLFARWYRLKVEVSDASIERLWRMATPADHEFWRSLDAAQEPQAAPGSDAEAKLTAIRAHCERKASEFSADMFAVRPQDIRVSAGDILAIIDGAAL